MPEGNTGAGGKESAEVHLRELGRAGLTSMESADSHTGGGVGNRAPVTPACPPL